jgi:zinc transport system ATP-binding protein
MDQTLLNIQDASLSYGKQSVVTNISFQVNKGEYIALIGVNGSGKTTLIKSILGLIKPTKGHIHHHEQLQIGYLPQRMPLQDKFFPATIEEIVATGLLVSQHFPRWITKQNQIQIEDALTKVGMLPYKKSKIGSLSGGQQQRVMLARMLVANPNLLILDEPTTALDSAIKHDFYDLLTALNRQGVTIIIVTHDMAKVGRYVSRIIELDNTVVFDGDFTEYCKNKGPNHLPSSQEDESGCGSDE